MKIHHCLLLGASLALTPALRAELRISEFQTDNLNILEDDELNTPDWIEIQNTGDADVDLAGYFLTDNPARLDKWEFPSLKVKAGGQIVVFASEKDQHRALTIFQQSNPIKPTHTNFRLDTSGEYLALVDPDGETVVHAYADAYPRQVGNVSYGLDAEGNPGYFPVPTPGEPNGDTGAIGPHVRDVVNVTGQPDVETTENIVITAEIEESLFPVSKVTLYYRFMFKGEASRLMKDDGEAPDETANDGIYTAEFGLASIFGSQIDAGEMVRWRVEAEDDQGNLMRDPLFHDPGNADEYYGTVALDASLETTNLEVLHWFIERPSAADNDSGTKASVAFLGEFYDNIHVDIHGQSTRSFPKKSWDFDFNSGRRFKYDEEEDRVRDFNLLTNWADKSKVRNTMAYEMYEIGGVKGHWAKAVRVQQNGEFLGTWDMVEDGDDLFTKRVGLGTGGALYKMYNRLDGIGSADPFAANGAEKKTRRYEGKDDVQALIDGISTGSGSEKLDYIYDHVDIPSMINFLAMNSTINNTDYGHKNYYVFRDTEGTGDWTQLPWDVDLSLGRRWISSHNYFYDPIQTTSNDVEGHIHGNRLAQLFMSNSLFNDMLYRRLRTLYDHFYGPPGGEPKSDYMLRRLDELVALIDPEGVVSDADLDYEKGLPEMERKFNQTNGWDNKDTMREAVARIKDEYIPGRRDYIYGLSKLPNEQKPYSQFNLEIAEVVYRPESGNQQEEYIIIQNKTGELVDLSHFQVTGAIEHTIKPGTVLPSGTIFSPDQGKLYLVRDVQAFRARTESPKGGERLFVQGNYGGQLSSRGEMIQILDPEGNVITEYAYEGDPSPAQAHLRITEILYAPAAPDAGSPYEAKSFEFIEITNIGDTEIDLSGLAFTDGVSFMFAEGTTLAPGTAGVVVSDRAAFESRYGTDVLVLGDYDGFLSNGGERVVLRDTREENIVSFSYDQEWSPEADAEGHSLEVVDASQGIDQWDVAEGWQTSTQAGGTPGSLDGSGGPIDPQPGDGMTYAKWQTTHFSAAELTDASISGPEGDANGDGFANLLAYAFDQDPHASLGSAIHVSESGYGVSFLQRTDADDLIYRVEQSAELTSWSPVNDPNAETTPVDGPTERITIKSDPSEPVAGNYLRVIVELKP